MKNYFLLNTFTGEAVLVFMADRDLADKACDIVRRNAEKDGHRHWRGWQVMETHVQFEPEEVCA